MMNNKNDEQLNEKVHKYECKCWLFIDGKITKIFVRFILANTQYLFTIKTMITLNCVAVSLCMSLAMFDDKGKTHESRFRI